MTNKRIIICQPKLGLSMDFTDYSWDDLEAAFVKENILGSVFSFSTKRICRFLLIIFQKRRQRKCILQKQMDIEKEPFILIMLEEIQFENIDSTEEIEEIETEE
jgi:hypothetical protein